MIHRFVDKAILGSFVTVSLLALASPARSQGVVPRSGDLSGTFGYSNLTGVDGNKHINFGATAGVNLSSSITVCGEYGYLPMGSAPASQYVSGVTGSVNGDYQQFGGAARLNLGSSKHIVPYGVVSFGYARLSAGASVTVAGAGSGSGSASLNGDYVGFGGGASIYLGKGVGVRPDFRYERQVFYSAGTSAGQNVALVTGSLFYQWGGHGKKKQTATAMR
jgi:hypothetical protein